MKTFGIDVSKWQGENFDFDRAASEGVKFAIVRGAYSAPAVATNAGKDTLFDRHYSVAKAAGLAVGCYQYSMAQTVSQAKAEADYLYENVLKGKTFELPIYYDVEDATQKKLGKRLLTDIVGAWCERLECKGFFVGVYASRSFFETYLYDNELTKYTHWVAEWGTGCAYANRNVLGMWQFGGETNKLRSNKVAGVTCDQNYMLVDFPAAIKAGGFNGFSKSSTATKTDIVYAVKAGDTLSGIAAKYGTTYQALAAYNGIENANVIRAGQIIKIPANTAKKAVSTGDKVRLTANATVYGSTARFASFAYNTILYVKEVNGSRAVISTQREGAVTGAVDVKHLVAAE